MNIKNLGCMGLMVVFVMAGVVQPFVGGVAIVAARTPVEATTTTRASATTTRASSGKTREAAAQKLHDRAMKEIDRRIEALNDAADRLKTIKKISAADKTSLNLTIQSQISLLNNLKTKIAADTDLATLKTDVQSITKAYRTFALVLPQIAILASADRWTAVADSFSSVAQKLEVRLGAMGTSTDPVMQNALISLKADIVDARAEIQKARDAVASLKPDNGDMAIATSNRKVLVSARAMLKDAYKSLESGRKEITTIRKNLVAQP